MNKPWCVKCGLTHAFGEVCDGFKVPEINERLGLSEVDELKMEISLLKEKLSKYEKTRAKRNIYQRDLMRKRAAHGSS